MIRAYITAFFAGLLSLVGVVLYRKGHKDADNDNQLQDAEEYAATRKRMDETGGPSDADVAKWLHERGKYKRPGDM